MDKTLVIRKSIVTAVDITLEEHEDPYRWPRAKKVFHTAIPAAFGFSCAFATSVYTPGIPDVVREMHISREVALLPFIIFVLGLSFGPIICAPLSETAGRRPVYWFFLPPAALFTLGAGFSNNIASLCICRFFAALLSSPVLSVGGATIADIYEIKSRAIPTSCFVMMPFLGPALGPVVGGFAAQARGWRWTQWVILFSMVIAYVPCLFMAETSRKALLRRKADKLGISAHTVPTLASAWTLTRTFVTLFLTRPVVMLLVEPVVGFLSLYVAFDFAILYCFFSAWPWIFSSVYGFDLGLQGLTFLSIGLGVALGFAILVCIDNHVYQRGSVIKVTSTEHLTSVKPHPPEHRLYGAFVGSVMIPPSLFWFGWSAQYHVQWICPAIAGLFFGAGNFLVFVSALMYFQDFYGPLLAASSLAANGFLRYIFGAAFPLFGRQMYQNLGIGWASSLLGFVAVALAPLPWVFFTFGPKLRKLSRYATE